MPVLDIDSQTRSALRAAAHPLKPVVLIGEKGLSDAVLQEIDRSLSAHGLIKVRAGGEDRAARDELLAHICDTLSCAPVHHLGKTLVLFRPTDDAPDADALLARRGKRSEVADLGHGGRKPSEPHIPKKLAAAGKPAPARTRSRTEREPEPLTARERYLGESGRRSRPSTHEETASRSGAARVEPAEAPRRKPAGLASTLGAARKRAASPGARPAPVRSALSLRAGARAGQGAQRTTATSRRPKSATKK
ncbi:YhbY family RNA-binding protein [Pigmentiphaga soli]|uniref:YhbY family RNA-binding protein n=1 Tax=Pigmentiphaga soli TaxID=1007095 RepID=A0ABP8H0J1_9BURK